MEFMERKRKVEHLLRVKFPFSWAPPPIRGPNAGLGLQEMHQRLMAKVEAERAVLMGMPDDELEKRFVGSGTEEQAKAEMRAAIEEKGRFFSKREAEADFNYWSKVEYWTLDESIALLLGKSPEIVTWKSIQAYVNISAFAKQYERLRNLALRAQAMNRGQSAAHPKVVLAWADEVAIQVPKGLREALERQWAKRHGSAPSAANQAPPASTPRPLAEHAVATVGKEDRDPTDTVDEAKTFAQSNAAIWSLTTDEVCEAFDRIGMTSRDWRTMISKNLPDWLTACRTMLGKTGANSVQARWDPLKIATALVTGKSRKAGAVPVARLDAAFKRQLLRRFSQDWEALRADNPAWGD